MDCTVGDRLSEVVSCLLKVATFCSCYSQLCNVHTVDFIVGEKWEQLSFLLRSELGELNLKQLQSLIDTSVSCFLSEKDSPHLLHFITEAKAHTLEVLKICSPMATISKSVPKTNVSRESPYWCMSPKKSHEVEVLASVISSLAKDKGVEVVVDVGSGKGYLSSYLAMEHRLNVLAVDSSSRNTSGAIERNKKVVYYRNKSHQKMNCDLSNTKSDILCDTCSYSENDVCCNCCKSPLIIRESNSHILDSSGGLFIPKTHSVSANCNLNYLISDFLHVLKENSQKNMTPEANRESMDDHTLLCSLHSCGNLSASMLKLFISTHQARILCSVGCCYHLLKEKFFESPFATNGTKDHQEFGFPLSSALLKQKYSLGRNARMLASQSIERLSEREMEPRKALYYRALLEVILRDKLGLSRDYTVGRIADKCSGFVQYVQRALRELKLDHLQEAVKEAHLVRLFDPVISPRCYGIIAWK